MHKDIAVAHGGARNRNSNRLFCVTNPDMSRRHLGGQLQSGDIFRSVHRHDFSSVGEASGGRLRSNAERDRAGSTTSPRSSIWHCAAATWMLAMASLQSAPRSVAIILSGKETAV